MYLSVIYVCLFYDRNAIFYFCNNRWTIETKYYSADTSVWTAHLGEDFSLGLLPNGVNLAALVMVFDMSDVRTYLYMYFVFN